MPDYDVYGVAIIPVIMALVAFAKMLGLPTKYTPLLSLILGIVAAMVYVAPGDWRKATFDGILIGLSASGLYSGAKYMSLNGKNSKNGIVNPPDVTGTNSDATGSSGEAPPTIPEDLIKK